MKQAQFGSRLYGLLSPWLAIVGQVWLGVFITAGAFVLVVLVIILFCLTPGWGLLDDFSLGMMISEIIRPSVWIAIGIIGFFLAVIARFVSRSCR